LSLALPFLKRQVWKLGCKQASAESLFGTKDSKRYYVSMCKSRKACVGTQYKNGHKNWE
jgi:hypothetical protein